MNISADALLRWSKALKLSRTERTYLFDMADRRDPQAHNNEADSAPETLIKILDSITIPAYILGKTWNVLGYNAPAQTLFNEWFSQNLEKPKQDAPPNSVSYTHLLF